MSRFGFSAVLLSALLTGAMPIADGFCADEKPTSAASTANGALPPSSPLPKGTGRFEFDLDGTPLEVFTFKPAGYDGQRMIFVMHGVNRNADEYRDHAQAMGSRFNALIIAPRFDVERFPTSKYQFGGIIAADKSPAPAESWTYNFIPKLAHAVRKIEARSEMPYWIIGHSAGGQFVARMAAFIDTGAERLVAANPGSQLFPTRELPFGYGFGDLPVELADDATLKRYLASPLTIYLGTADNKPDRYFDQREAAMKQGDGRWQRGHACFKLAQQVAQKKGWPCNWRLVEAANVPHHHELMFDHEQCGVALFGNAKAADTSATNAADASSGSRYRPAPQAIADVLNAPPTPSVSLSPTREFLLLVERASHPPIADLAAPMLKLAGLRINPETNGPHLAPRSTGLILQTVENDSQRRIELPAAAQIGFPSWSPDGKHIGFSVTVENGIELWVAEVKTAKARRIDGVTLNDAYGNSMQWMPDSRSLLVQTVVAGRGQAPAPRRAPLGPTVEESAGRAGPVRTYQDLLQNSYDEELFDYYCSSQIRIVDVERATARQIGEPGLYASVESSPDGLHLLVERTLRPYSYLLPAGRFPSDVAVWDLNGQVEHKLASHPLQDRIPIDGVPTGPRSPNWRPTESATLVWAEALDGGDPRTKAAHRDRVLTLAAPFDRDPAELAKVEHRFAGVSWGAKNGLAFLRDYDRERRWIRTVQIDADDSTQPPQLIWERSINDQYGDPGSPVQRPLANGRDVMWQHGDAIFLEGNGATPHGDRPFLDRFDLTTRKSERLFVCDDASYESVVALLSDDASRFITRHESPSEAPNYFVRGSDAARKKLTDFRDPMPQLRKITKQLVTYQREDGVPLSFTLYLPPDHKPGQKLPTLVWAYPREFNDAATAGQVSGSTNRFTSIGGTSHLFLLTQGYAVLDAATMPVVGNPAVANDTFVEQIVASARAAIDKADELGVIDRNRVGVGGHSYGAFMTANLLAHSDLFRAGVARSGAYNRTLTPFGFQNERRTFWEAPDIYFKMSPFMAADKINEPILLIHGEDDNNPGTFPIQSERLYQAIRGNGGTVRYVTLPHESHGYSARESVEHTLWEMVNWFDRHVKSASPIPELAE